MPRYSPIGYIRQFVDLYRVADGPVISETYLNPALFDIDYFLDGGTMSRTTYTLAHTTMPDGLARNVTAVRTDAAAGDTGLTLVITGTDNDGVAITETLTLTTSTTVYATTQAFKTFTAAISALWVIGGVTADTIEIGYGNLIGLNYAFAAAADVLAVQADIGTAQTVVAGAGATLALSTVDASAATFNGTKDVLVQYRPSHSTVLTGTGTLVVQTSAALGFEAEVEEFGFVADAALVGGSAAQSFTLKNGTTTICTLALVAGAAGSTQKTARTDITVSAAPLSDTSYLVVSRVTGGTAFTSGSGHFYVRLRQRAQRPY